MVRIEMHGGSDRWSALGFLPSFLDENDPRPAREQFNANYGHGGGWRPISGFTMRGATLIFPGDPPFFRIATIYLHKETIHVYEYALVAIVQEDGSVEVARMD